MRRLTTALVAALLVLGATGATPAHASTRSEIVKDCSDDGVLQGSYSPSDIRDARQHLPSDVAEYTDCSDVLRRAELPGGGGSDGGAGGGAPPASTGGVPPATGGAVAPATGAAPATSGAAPQKLVPETDQDRQALIDSRSSGDRPVEVGGQNLLAGASPLRGGYRANGLPTSLIVALVLLGLAGIALSIPPVRRGLRWPPRLRRPFTRP